MMDYVERCRDCICLVSEHGKWICDECGQPCEDVGRCPEGLDDED